MNIIPVGFEHTIARRLRQDKDGAFIEEFDSLLAKHDTSDVWRQFAIWMLIDPEHGVIRFVGSSSIQRDAILRVAELFIHDCKDADQWKAAASSAEEAAKAADAEASDAVHAVHNDDYNWWEDWKAASAADAAALTAAYIAEDVARGITGFDIVSSAAEEAAEAAGCYRYSFSDVYSSHRAAVEAHRETMADKLIELLKQAPEKT